MSTKPFRIAAAATAALSVLAGADLALGGRTSGLQPLVISRGAEPAGALYPGASVELRVSVANPNDVPVGVGSIVLDGAITSDDERACPAASHLTFARATRPTTSISAQTTAQVTLRGALTMSADAPQGCAGRTFRIPLAAQPAVVGS